MTRTELLTNLIRDTLTNNRTMTVETFRDMYVNYLPGKLAFLAVSRDCKHVLPVFEPNYDYPQTDVVDYNQIRKVIGNEWMPLITAHVWNQLPGQIPQTLLTVDGIVDEKVLQHMFGTLPHWTKNIGTVFAYNFGHYDLNTLPGLSMYTIDVHGVRRIHTLNEKDEGRVYDIQLDVWGNIRYFDRELNKHVYARFVPGCDRFEWKHLELKH